MTENNHTLNVTAWVQKGYTLESLRTFTSNGKVDGMIVRLNSGADDEKEQVSKRYKEFSEIAHDEGYALFLVQVNPLLHREADVLLIPMKTLNNVFVELKMLDLYGVLDIHAPHLLGSLEKLQKTHAEMLEGSINKSIDFFDILYDVSFVQAMMTDEQIDSASFNVMAMLDVVLKVKTEEELLTIGVDLAKSSERGFFVKDDTLNHMPKLTSKENVAGLESFFRK